MSWSIRSVDWPPSAIARRWRAERLALGRVQAGRRLVEQQQTRLRRQRPGHADELAVALREIGRARLGGPPEVERARAPRRSPAGRCASRTRSSRPASGPGRRRGSPRRAGRRTARRSATCARARAAARACGARPRRSRPSSSTPPAGVDEAGDRVDERRLAGAVGADQADELALADLEADVAQRVHAAEVDRQPLGGQHRRSGGLARGARRLRERAGSRGAAAARLPLGRDDRALLVRLLVERAGDALGVLQQRDDQDHAAEQQEPVAAEPEPLVERIGEQRLGRDQAGEDGAGDQRDAAGVGERDQAQRGERVEAVGARPSRSCRRRGCRRRPRSSR